MVCELSEARDLWTVGKSWYYQKLMILIEKPSGTGPLRSGFDTSEGSCQDQLIGNPRHHTYSPHLFYERIIVDSKQHQTATCQL